METAWIAVFSLVVEAVLIGTAVCSEGQWVIIRSPAGGPSSKPRQ